MFALFIYEPGKEWRLYGEHYATVEEAQVYAETKLRDNRHTANMTEIRIVKTERRGRAHRSVNWN